MSHSDRKSRMFEEDLKRATNRRYDEVVIGVTFNNNMRYDKMKNT